MESIAFTELNNSSEWNVVEWVEIQGLKSVKQRGSVMEDSRSKDVKYLF